MKTTYFATEVNGSDLTIAANFQKVSFETVFTGNLDEVLTYITLASGEIIKDYNFPLGKGWLDFSCEDVNECDSVLFEMERLLCGKVTTKAEKVDFLKTRFEEYVRDWYIFEGENDLDYLKIAEMYQLSELESVDGLLVLIYARIAMLRQILHVSGRYREYE